MLTALIAGVLLESGISYVDKLLSWTYGGTAPSSLLILLPLFTGIVGRIRGGWYKEQDDDKAAPQGHLTNQQKWLLPGER